jgi:hypothetical protein
VGTVLVAPSTGKTLPTLSGLEKHPLDILESKRMEKDISTMDMVDMDGKRTIQDSQEAWKKFRDAD